MLLRQFQHQIELQCRAVLLSAAQLNEALKARDSYAIWIFVQNLLNAAANISKVCWGSGGRLTKERLAVRRSIHVTSRSPLKDVAMRNNFEHLDERLDLWWRTSPSRNHLDLSVFPKNAVRGIDERDMFRVLDPETMDVVFWGQRFSLQKIVGEAQRLLPIAAAEAAKPHWTESEVRRHRAQMEAATRKAQRAATPSGSAPRGSASTR